MTKVKSTHPKHHLYFWGHLSKGLIYVIVGGIALATVLGRVSDPKGPERIATYLQDEWLGQVLLGILAIGFFAYCAWRWYKAIVDESGEGNDHSGILRRTGFATSGVMYGLLGLYIVTLLAGSGSPEGDKQDLVVEIMQSPVGTPLVAVLALAALIAAYYQFRRVWTREYMEDLRTGEMTDKERRSYRIMGRIGYASRVLVYLVIAYFLVRAVIQQDPTEYRGIGGALSYLHQGAGVYLVALIGLGLLLYGSFVIVKANYRDLA